ncbi:hypothetical protein RYR53_002428 [Aeromonas hydrophila]|nr:hypothetical protein [Aeromonas hydrophila]
MQVSLPSSAISRPDAYTKSDEPQGRVAQLEAKAAKIREHLKELTSQKEDNEKADPQAEKARQDHMNMLRQQLEQIMAEIARLRAEEARTGEPIAGESQATPAVANASPIPNVLPPNSTFSIRV